MELAAAVAIIAMLVMVVLFALFAGRAERAFQRELAGRTLQTPEEFASFYATSKERAIALRLLPIYSDFFGIEPGRLRPEDRPPEIVEIDTVELILEIETEFGISIPDRDAEGLSGSFDSIVQYLVRKCSPQAETAA